MIETNVEPKRTLSDQQPIIGVPVPVRDQQNELQLILEAESVWAIERAGGRIFLIPLWPLPLHKHTYQALWSLVPLIDGLFLPEGKLEDENRQSIEWHIALAQLVSVIGMPLLAIGAGAMLWNRALANTQQHTATMPSLAQPGSRQRLRVRTPSLLASALRPAIEAQQGTPQPWELSSGLHLRKDQLAPGLRSCAHYAQEGIAAFERVDDVFGLGILGKPAPQDQYATSVFASFIAACKSSRKQQEWETQREFLCSHLAETIQQGLPLLPHSEEQVSQVSSSERVSLSRVHSSKLHENKGDTHRRPPRSPATRHVQRI